MLYAGIDPGLKGAIAVIDDDGCTVQRLVCMPTIDGARRAFDEKQILDRLKWLHWRSAKIVIEVGQVRSLQRGVVTNLMHCGFLRGCLCAIGTDPEMAQARTWVERLRKSGILPPAPPKPKRVKGKKPKPHDPHKLEHIDAANRLFGESLEDVFGRPLQKGEDGLADALLLAYYCRLIHRDPD